MRKATLKDVARLAGVSAATVSRVLSGNSMISEKTCERVRSAADALNYTPNTAARSLRCEKSRSIGVVFPDISGEFYATCASAILKYARLAGYTVLFTESGRDINSERESIRALMERCVDGIIFIGDNSDEGIIYDLAARSVPVVLGDRYASDIPSVTFNNRSTVKNMTDALYKSGCRRFLYIGEPTDGQCNLSERYGGFTDALSAYTDVRQNVIFDERLHIDKPKTAYELFSERITDIMPDAVITSNDLIAHGIISAANAYGIDIPRDMAVTGFDDMICSAYFVPSVTTVRQNVDELARRCFDMLMCIIDGETTQSSVIEQELIIRSSALRKGGEKVDQGD